ncbi:hypothetical protein GCM10010174_45770 [Kutzneria viridogrisea]|uniref:Membrane protein YgcG n=1 Tax=Kutzneria viridogrisea TaxID=47990 RepID=A0ABR6BIY0_9PSEU|nr:putative membrane protein YgcG [Kutzneria viridogrisea]
MWPFDRQIAGEAHAAFDHKTIYDQLQGGRGPGELSTAVGNWQTDVGERFDHIHGLITAGLRKASAIWEGSAADSFHGDVTPMAQFVLDAKQVSHSVGQSTQDQANHFADVRHKMPPPVKVEATDTWLSRSWTHLGGGKTDAEQQEQAAMEASDKAAGIYADYRNSSTSTTTAVASYPMVPQSNGIDAIPPQQPGGPLPYNPGDPGPLGPGGGPRTPRSTDQRGPANRPPAQLPPDETKLQDYPTPTPGPVRPPSWDRFPIQPPPPPISTPGPPPVIVPPPGVPIGGPGEPPGSGRGPGGSGRGPTGPGGGAGSSGTGGRSGSGGGPRGGGPGSGTGLGELGERGLAGRGAAGAPGRAGAAGGPGVGGSAGRGKGGKGEEDLEHTNKFLEPTDEHWGTGVKTVPPVIGDPGYQP